MRTTGLEVCVLLLQGWPTSQRPSKSHNSYCVTAVSHIIHMTHMSITPSLPCSHIYLCLDRFIVHITHQHGNDRTLQIIYCYACFSGTYGNYIRAAWNQAMSIMRLASRTASCPPLCYCIQCRCKMKMTLYLNALQQTASSAFEVFKIWVMIGAVTHCWFFTYFYLGIFEKVRNFGILLS